MSADQTRLGPAVWLLACCALWLWPERAAAQPALPGTALIVRVPGDERIFVPLRAELGSYRFRVLELPDRPGRSGETLAELATARDAQAALRARPDGMAVELWVQGTGPDKDVGSEEVVSAGPSRNPDLLALRVTEAMRARGLHLPPPTAAASARTTPPTAAGAAGAPALAPATLAVPRPGSETASAAPAPASAPAPKPATESPAAPKPATETAPTPKPPVAAVASTTAPKPAAETATPKPAPATAKPAPTAKPASKPANPTTAKPSPLASGRPAAGEAKAQTTAPTAAVSSTAPALPPRRPLLFAEAAPLGVLNPGSSTLGPAIDALAQLRLQPYPSSSISLFGFIPIWQAPIERDEGSVEVRAWAIGGFADFHVPLKPVELSAGLGAGAMLLSVRATARRAPGMDGESPQRLPVFLGRIGVSLALTRDLRLSARVMAGLLAPPLRIQIGDQTTTWGRPLVLGSLGLELALPWER